MHHAPANVDVTLLGGPGSDNFWLFNQDTDGDAAIHFRHANVITTGDMLFRGLFPFIDLDSGGSVLLM